MVADDTTNGMRYRMLETLREYAAVLLDERGDRAEVQARHVAWCTALADRVAVSFDLRDRHASTHTSSEVEYDNLQAALVHCASADDGLRLATGLAFMWVMRGHLATGRSHLERLLAVPGTDPVLRARALGALGWFALGQDDQATAQTALQESITLFLQHGDPADVAWPANVATISAYMSGDADLSSRMAADCAAAAALLGTDLALSRARFTAAFARWCEGPSVHRRARQQVGAVVIRLARVTGGQVQRRRVVAEGRYAPQLATVGGEGDGSMRRDREREARLHEQALEHRRHSRVPRVALTRPSRAIEGRGDGGRGG